MAQHPISRAEGERRVTTPRPWWQRAVFYENHLPTFRDGNGDGVGDLLVLTTTGPLRLRAFDGHSLGPLPV